MSIRHLCQVKTDIFLEETGVEEERDRRAEASKSCRFPYPRIVTSLIPLMNEGTVVGLAG